MECEQPTKGKKSMSDAAAPRMTRSASKRSVHAIAPPLNTGPPPPPPPLKSGLTEIFSGQSLDEQPSSSGAKRAKKAVGGINDKVQQKKWANKREVSLCVRTTECFLYCSSRALCSVMSGNPCQEKVGILWRQRR